MSRTLPIALLIGTLFLLMGCDVNIGIGSSRSTGTNSLSASVATGTTSKAQEKGFNASEGDTITVSYRATVRDGELTIRLFKSGLGGETLERVTLRQGATSSFSVTAPSTGGYRIEVRPRNFGGDYTVSWSVQ